MGLSNAHRPLEVAAAFLSLHVGVVREQQAEYGGVAVAVVEISEEQRSAAATIHGVDFCTVIERRANDVELLVPCDTVAQKSDVNNFLGQEVRCVGIGTVIQEELNILV
jgi:hypothetical protein